MTTLPYSLSTMPAVAALAAPTAASGYRATLITSFEELAPLAEAWDQLAGAAPFRRFAWASAWWQAYRTPRRELAVVVVHNNEDRVVAIAPLTREAGWRHGLALGLLGGGEACGDGLSVLAAPGCEALALDAIANKLTEWGRTAGWDYLCLDGVEQTDELVAGLVERLHSYAARVETRSDASRWVIQLPRTYEDYVAGLGKRMRRFVRQTERDLGRSGLQCEVRQPRSQEEVAAMFAQLVELHGKRWSEDGEPGAFASASFTSFLADVAQRWYAEGALRLFVLTLDGAPAAAAIGVRTGDTFSAFLLGRDPDFDHVRAGWLLNLAMIESAIAEGAAVFDFLRGDEEYKSRLGAAPVPQCRVCVTAPGALNGMRAMAASGRQAARAARDSWRRRCSASAPAAKPGRED